MKKTFMAIFAAVALASCGGNAATEGTHTHEDGTTHEGAECCEAAAQEEFTVGDSTCVKCCVEADSCCAAACAKCEGCKEGCDKCEGCKEGCAKCCAKDCAKCSDTKVCVKEDCAKPECNHEGCQHAK